MYAIIVSVPADYWSNEEEWRRTGETYESRDEAADRACELGDEYSFCEVEE